jgi:hypothetical protein
MGDLAVMECIPHPAHEALGVGKRMLEGDVVETTFLPSLVGDFVP